jgi:CMP-N-acetylneuraminic acid synthetase
MKHLAFIPARGGSTGILNKNLELVGGKPIVRWAYDFCSENEIFDTVLLSTDSPKISETIFKSDYISNLIEDRLHFLSKKEAIHRRSQTDSGTFSLIKDLVIKLSEYTELNFDYLWLIQPTSIFREKNDIKLLLKIIEGKMEWTSIVSVKDFTSNHPERMFNFKENYLEPFMNDTKIENIPRQLLQKVYIKDGAFYIFKKTNLQNNIFLGDKVLPYFRSSSRNVNIDDYEDLNYARYVMDKND